MIAAGARTRSFAPAHSAVRSALSTWVGLEPWAPEPGKQHSAAVTEYVCRPPAVVSLSVVGDPRRFPVRRVFCVGRNFAEHAKEMGEDAREPPFFFCKPADALVDTSAGDGTQHLPYPPSTEELHHEVEMVVAIGGPGGYNIPVEQASSHVFGLGVGLDLTRRDVQAQAKAMRRPWDLSKGFDNSAPVGALTPARAPPAAAPSAAEVRAQEQARLDDINSGGDGGGAGGGGGEGGGAAAAAEPPTLSQPCAPLLARASAEASGAIELKVNGDLVQQGDLSELVWSVPELIANLSTHVALQPGDVIFSGTPAGVGEVRRGDSLEATVAGLAPMRCTVGHDAK